MKIYISGPMTGLPEFNYRAFDKAAKMLRARNHFVYSPAEIKPPFEARKHFAEYCAYICTQADALYMLDGWKGSQGAKLEYDLAVICGVGFLYEADAWKGDVLDGLL